MDEQSAESSQRQWLALHESESRFRSLADSAPLLLWMAGVDGLCEYVNKCWLEFVGREIDQELAGGWIDNVHADDRDAALATYHQAFAARAACEIEYRLRRHDGEYRWMLSTAAPRYSENGEFAGFVGSCVDITERKRSEAALQQLLTSRDEAHARLAEETLELYRLAGSDPLTGVLNRRSFREQLEREWHRSVRHHRPLACIMLDLDFFKRVNDTHGHAGGDAILKAVVATLSKQCRPSDLICRYGGEEFCIMTPETTEAGAATLAERLRSVLANTWTGIVDTPVWITSSFGVAERVEDMEDFNQLIEHADQALHIAKNSGRDRVIRFGHLSTGRLADPHDSDDDATRTLASRTARDLATPTEGISWNETVEKAVELLLRNPCGMIPVVDDDGMLRGCISDHDLMLLDVSPRAWSGKVRDVMKTNAVCYDESTPARQVFQFLCRVAAQRIVVVKDARPIGVISSGSLLAHFQGRVAEETAGCSALN